MIKIPLNKYQNLDSKHLNKLGKSIKNSIQFYINCSDIIIGNKGIKEINSNISPKFNKTNIKKHLAAISTRSLKQLTDYGDAFISKAFRRDFLSQVPDIKILLSQMINPKSDYYYEHILLSKPDVLISIHQKLAAEFSVLVTTDLQTKVFEDDNTNEGVVYSILVMIFNYSSFQKGILVKDWGAYSLCEELDINVCPYCNRLYTFTVIGPNGGDKITRPELDHFFPKSKFPLFSLSFFNLIPSCKVCNSYMKKDDYLKLDNYLHPYLNEISPMYKFDYMPLDTEALMGKNKNNQVIINNNGFYDEKTEGSLEKFHIKQIYNQHRDIIPTYVNKHRYYPDSVLEEISQLITISKEELYKTLYGSTLESNIIDTSLGRFHNDLFDKFIKYYNIRL